MHKVELIQVHDELMQDPEFVKEYAAENLIHRVALRILKYRQEAGLTQAELAERVGKKQPYVARVEGGFENITLRTLASFAQALGRDPEAFVRSAEVETAVMASAK